MSGSVMFVGGPIDGRVLIVPHGVGTVTADGVSYRLACWSYRRARWVPGRTTETPVAILDGDRRHISAEASRSRCITERITRIEGGTATANETPDGQWVITDDITGATAA